MDQWVLSNFVEQTPHQYQKHLPLCCTCPVFYFLFPEKCCYQLFHRCWREYLPYTMSQCHDPDPASITRDPHRPTDWNSLRRLQQGMRWRVEIVHFSSYCKLRDQFYCTWQRYPEMHFPSYKLNVSCLGEGPYTSIASWFLHLLQYWYSYMFCIAQLFQGNEVCAATDEKALLTADSRPSLYCSKSSLLVF